MTLATIGAYDGEAASSVGRRAVVVGGSVAGLCAARVLQDAFAEVVIVERDELPDGPRIRDGAPQTGQPHSLLEAGRATLEAFLPGFGRDLRARGALKLDMSGDFEWYDHGDCVAEADAPLPALYASRPLFEHVVRERVLARDGVRSRDGCHVFDYEFDPAAGRVTGVRFRDDGGDEATLDADLVVDATGRTSRTPQWLDAHGFPTPAVDRVAVDVTYSTVRIDRPPEVACGTLVAPEADRPRGAAMLPMEDGQWEVLLQGMHGERAPTDPDTFREWTASLPLDTIDRQVREHAWNSEVRRYPFPASLRRHYADLDRFPDGLLVTGDAIASFNPVYGQGMSVAALDALVLHRTLRNGLDGLGPRFFADAREIVDEVWQIAVGNDFLFDATTGPKPFGTDLFNRYVERLLRRAHDDGHLTEAFFRVFRLERPATSLLRPSVAWRVLRPSLS